MSGDRADMADGRDTLAIIVTRIRCLSTALKPDAQPGLTGQGAVYEDCAGPVRAPPSTGLEPIDIPPLEGEVAGRKA